MLNKRQSLVYKWLTEKNQNNVNDFKISWNFNKFLINPDGILIKHFGSSMNPFKKEIKSL